MSDEEDGYMSPLEDDPGERIALIQAELVAKEKEALDAIKEDICDWLSDVLELNITRESFLDVLDTGIAVCRLATLVQNTAQVSGDKVDFQVPMKALSCNSKAEAGTFFARDNTSNFIDWCRKLGVEEAVIFESEGLVLHRDEKRVILCLLDVARFAERVGISPPQLVKMEREIEELEANASPEIDINLPATNNSPCEQNLKTIQVNISCQEETESLSTQQLPSSSQSMPPLCTHSRNNERISRPSQSITETPVHKQHTEPTTKHLDLRTSPPPKKIHAFSKIPVRVNPPFKHIHHPPLAKPSVHNVISPPSTDKSLRTSRTVTFTGSSAVQSRLPRPSKKRQREESEEQSEVEHTTKRQRIEAVGLTGPKDENVESAINESVDKKVGQFVVCCVLPIVGT